MLLTDEQVQKLVDEGLSSGSEFVGPDSKRAELEAKKLRLRVVFPAENELLVDIDSCGDFKAYENLINIVDRYCGVVSKVEAPSRSKQHGRKHITVQLKNPLTGVERICLQLCLGSDRKWELLSLVQELRGDPHPTLFLER